MPIDNFFKLNEKQKKKILDSPEFQNFIKIFHSKEYISKKDKLEFLKNFIKVFYNSTKSDTDAEFNENIFNSIIQNKDNLEKILRFKIQFQFLKECSSIFKNIDFYKKLLQKDQNSLELVSENNFFTENIPDKNEKKKFFENIEKVKKKNWLTSWKIFKKKSEVVVFDQNIFKSEKKYSFYFFKFLQIFFILNFLFLFFIGASILIAKIILSLVFYFKFNQLLKNLDKLSHNEEIINFLKENIYSLSDFLENLDSEYFFDPDILEDFIQKTPEDEIKNVIKEFLLNQKESNFNTFKLSLIILLSLIFINLLILSILMIKTENSKINFKIDNNFISARAQLLCNLNKNLDFQNEIFFKNLIENKKSLLELFLNDSCVPEKEGAIDNALKNLLLIKDEPINIILSKENNFIDFSKNENFLLKKIFEVDLKQNENLTSCN